jgi:hypothetical protein
MRCLLIFAGAVQQARDPRTAAVLVLAKERKLIPAYVPLLLALKEQWYCLSDDLVAALLNSELTVQPSPVPERRYRFRSRAAARQTVV